MKVKLESTDHLVRIDGTLCRVWTGRTERGVPVIAFILRLAVDEAEDSTEADLDLVLMSAPEITQPNGGTDDGKWK